MKLERATGGDTPVLRFRTDRGAVVGFLVDTGASSSLITPAAAGRLGLASQPMPPQAFALAGAGNDCAELRPRRARLPMLRLDGQGPRLLISGSEALVLPVPGLPSGIDGVLGAPCSGSFPSGSIHRPTSSASGRPPCRRPSGKAGFVVPSACRCAGRKGYRC